MLRLVLGVLLMASAHYEVAQWPTGLVQPAWDMSAPVVQYQSSPGDNYLFGVFGWYYPGIANSYQAWGSTDGGATWQEYDADNRITGVYGNPDRYKWGYVVDSGKIYVFYRGTSDYLSVAAFDMATQTWGTPVASSYTGYQIYGVYKRTNDFVLVTHGPSTSIRAVTWDGNTTWNAFSLKSTAYYKSSTQQGDNIHVLFEDNAESKLALGRLTGTSFTSATIIPYTWYDSAFQVRRIGDYWTVVVTNADADGLDVHYCAYETDPAEADWSVYHIVSGLTYPETPDEYAGAIPVGESLARMAVLWKIYDYTSNPFYLTSNNNGTWSTEEIYDVVPGGDLPYGFSSNMTVLDPHDGDLYLFAGDDSDWRGVFYVHLDGVLYHASSVTGYRNRAKHRRR